jgi:hypothetical protein
MYNNPDATKEQIEKFKESVKEDETPQSPLLARLNASE